MEGIDIALGPAAALSRGQQALPIAEAVSADAHAGQVVVQTAALPPGGAGLLLGDKVGGQMAVGMNIQGQILLGGVAAVLFKAFRLRFRFRGGGLRNDRDGGSCRLRAFRNRRGALSAAEEEIACQ